MNSDDKRLELQRLLRNSPRATQSISRRELLRRAGIGAGAVSASALLAACGIGGEEEENEGQKDTLTTTEQQGELDFANWPFYIDPGKNGTVADFEKKTGIDVSYKDVIDDNAAFFATIREPLASGQPTGWDIIVVTDWLITKMARLGYLEKLDHSLLPNFEAHAGEVYKDPEYDPDNMHSIPWQGGITGIGYNEDLTGREITSVEDLFDPEFEGRVGMFSEMRDTMCLTLLGLGIEPVNATIEDVEQAQQKLLEQKDANIVRKYYGNEYIDAFARGDLAVTMAWSGDVVGRSANKPNLKFVVPDEGGLRWVDNMAIPQDAAHPIDAHEMMNYVYDPQVQADITAWVGYITPVPEVQSILSEYKDNFSQAIATSPLSFPDEAMESQLHRYKDLTEDEETQWNDLFNEVVL
ncbi:MAG: spermidine/putrescine ABC transporter substrate-binding protein [Actinomycetota bacterium]|nr:spermidine/putrescine ABC transporter substrate-binding protein [Actinomycetota bacterium]